LRQKRIEYRLERVTVKKPGARLIPVRAPQFPTAVSRAPGGLHQVGKKVESMTEIANWQDNYAAGLAALAAQENMRVFGTSPNMHEKIPSYGVLRPLVLEWANRQDEPFTIEHAAKSLGLYTNTTRRVLIKLIKDGKVTRWRDSHFEPFLHQVISE